MQREERKRKIERQTYGQKDKERAIQTVIQREIRGVKEIQKETKRER